MITMQQAYDAVPEQYHRYISDQGRFNKRQNKYVESAYMSTAGRIAMFVDEHKEKGARYEVQTWYENVEGIVLCRAEVTSSIYGKATAHAECHMDATSGVDSTNPLSNGETSAVGRCLGMFGIANFSAGLAGAEDVASAINAQEKQPADLPLEKARKRNWSLARGAMLESGKTDDDMRQYMKSTFGLESTKDMSDEQWEEVVEWLALPAIVAPVEPISADTVAEIAADDDDIEDGSWGHVKALCALHEIDWGLFGVYVLSKNQQFKKTNVWQLPAAVATRYAKMIESPAKDEMLREMSKIKV